MDEKTKVKIPQVCFCGYNCTDKGGGIYWEPRNKDQHGRTWCNYRRTYDYPSDRQGCFHFKSLED